MKTNDSGNVILVRGIDWLLTIAAVWLLLVVAGLAFVRQKPSTAVRVGYWREADTPACGEARLYNPLSDRSRLVAYGQQPVWSPSGDQVVVAACDSAPYLYIYDDHRTMQHSLTAPTLTAPTHSNTPAAWSADGRYMAFLDTATAQPILTLYDTTTSTLTPIVTIPLAYDVIRFLWSDEGTRLLYPTISDDRTRYYVYDVATMTTSDYHHFDTFFYPNRAGWTADWRYVAYQDGHSSTGDAIIDLHTDEKSPLPIAILDAPLYWSPDGRYVAWIENLSLMVYDMQTASARVWSPGQTYKIEAWWPDSSRIAYRAPSNDGTNVLTVSAAGEWERLGPAGDPLLHATLIRLNMAWHPVGLGVGVGLVGLLFVTMGVVGALRTRQNVV